MRHFKQLCLVSCLFISMNAFAAEEVTVGLLKYQLNGSEAYVSGYVGEPTDVVIPMTIESKGQAFSVTRINANSFMKCNSITNLTSTGANLKIVGENAFRECSNLKQVNLICAEESSINATAFLWCNSLEVVNLTCSKIGYEAFAGCAKLQKVILKDVKSIGIDCDAETLYGTELKGGYTFALCPNLSYVDLGDKLEGFGNRTFVDCENLSYIVIPKTCVYLYVLAHYVSPTQYSWKKYNLGDNSSLFEGCVRLQSIIYLGDQNSKCGSNATVYHAKDQVHWSNTEFDYQGVAPTATFTSDMPAGFVPTTYDMSALEKNVGTYTQNVPFTFTNDDMSFNVDIPYTYTINPAKLTAKAKDASRLYGDGNPQFSSEYSGFVNNEDASVVTSNGSYTTTATEKSDVGTYAIKQSGATAQNYVFEYEDGTLTVNKAPLTMTANDKTMTYGNNIPVFDISYEGLKNNETQPAWVTKPALSSTVTPTSNVGTYPITISNADAKNYDLTIHNGTLTVEKAELTAKVDNKSRLYGDANPEFTLTYTGLKHNETVPAWEQEPTFETTATTQSNVGNYPVSLKNAVAVNYNITPVEGTLTVNKAPLKVTPKDCTRKYGEQNPAFELSYEGLKNSENQPEWTEEPIITTNATTASSVGEYAITVKSAEARNYSLEKGSGTLTVTKAPVTIKLQDATRKYGTANPNFEMSYTGLIDSETTPAWTTYPTITTTAKEKSDVGDYAITAEGGELKNYEFDGITPGVLSVTPASLVVRAQNASKSYFEENPMLSYLCTGFVQGDNTDLFTVKPQLSTTATLQSPVGIYTIEVGGGEIKNYQVSYVKGQLTVDKRTLTVSTNDYTRAYGEENPEFELTYKGFVNNEDENVLMAKPKASTVADKNTDTGVYDITIANGVAENYAFNYVGGKLTIEKAYQTLTWDQNLTGINLYDQVELTAKASSGLEVQYTLEPNSVCSLVKIGHKQYLDCFAEGEAVLIAQQEGNNNYWQTTKMYKSVKIGGDSGIDAIQLELDPSARIYNAQGKLIPSLQHGLNIIKIGDGTIKKVMVK